MHMGSYDVGSPCTWNNKTRRDPTSSTGQGKPEPSPKDSHLISLGGSRSVCWQVANAAYFPKVWTLDGLKKLASESEPTQEEETIPSYWKKTQQDFFFPILENETKDYKDMFCVLQNYAFSETSQLSVVFWARASTLNTGCVCERMNKWGRARGTQNKLHVSFLRLHDILSLPAFKPQDSEFLLTSWGFSSFPA